MAVAADVTTREREIFAATLDLVAEHGYDRLTMDAVAAACRAGKATLYRRWASKAELVVAAVHDLKCGAVPTPADTGSVRGDLLSAFCSGTGLDDPRLMAVMSGLVTAVHSDPELRNAFLDGFVGPRREEMELVFRRAVDRGELPADADVVLLASVLPSIVMFHASYSPGQVTDGEFITRVVDTVVLPMIGQRP